MSFIFNAIREADKISNALIDNSQGDLLILHTAGVTGRVGLSPQIRKMIWNSPPPNWIKANVDGSAHGFVKNCRGFVKSCFSYPTGICFAFEAEIFAFILAIEFASSFN